MGVLDSLNSGIHLLELALKDDSVIGIVAEAVLGEALVVVFPELVGIYEGAVMAKKVYSELHKNEDFQKIEKAAGDYVEKQHKRFRRVVKRTYEDISSTQNYHSHKHKQSNKKFKTIQNDEHGKAGKYHHRDDHKAVTSTLRDEKKAEKKTKAGERGFEHAIASWGQSLRAIGPSEVGDESGVHLGKF